MAWTEASSGQEAFDHVLAHLKAGPMKAVDFMQCPGFQLWARFLRRMPKATLGECLTEFEHMQRKQGNAAWPLILIEALGDADDGVRARIVNAATGEAALNLLSSRRLTKDEAKIARECRHRGNARHGKGAPADARKPGRVRRDG